MLNARFAFEPSEIMDLGFMRKFARWDKEEVKRYADEVPVFPNDEPELFEKCFGAEAPGVLRQERLHASPPFPFVTEKAEFVRFSAFRNDRRILPDGSLRRGTYVTSARDAQMVPSGYAAVGRYALPNPLPAVHRFDILLRGPVQGLVGTVAPAYSQAGGGVEVELVYGAPAASVRNHSQISEH